MNLPSTRPAVWISSLLILSASSVTAQRIPTVDEQVTAMKAFGKRHADARYKLGGCSDSAVDCSCFMQRLFHEIYAHPLPRTTWTQDAALKAHGTRVGGFDSPKDLDPERLCVGDLIYTYRRGKTWAQGPRHVSVYIGDGRVLHAAAVLGRIGESPLQWFRDKFQLRGVYRPLGCAVRVTDRFSDPAPSSLPPLAARPESSFEAVSPETHPSVPSQLDPANRPIRAVIAELFQAWEKRDIVAYSRLFTESATQLKQGVEIPLSRLLENRREQFQNLRQVETRHDILSVKAWPSFAFVEIRYRLELTFRNGRRVVDRGTESYMLERSGETWQIRQNEIYDSPMP